MSRIDTLKGVVGDLARPFAIWAASSAASIATVRLAWEGDDLNAAAVYMAAIWGGVSALYWGKVIEKREEAKQAANVEVAKAATPPPAPGTATMTAAPDVTATLTVEDKPGAADGELPPDKRVTL